jgi:hypothetical protein
MLVYTPYFFVCVSLGVVSILDPSKILQTFSRAIAVSPQRLSRNPQPYIDIKNFAPLLGDYGENFLSQKSRAHESFV